MLPSGVTVQDEHGHFLLVNDAAAMQLRLSGSGQARAPSPELTQRRETGLELLRAGRAAITEECATSGEIRQVFLTAFRPVRIAERNLLVSSSTGIGEQKTIEDRLFRPAYHDELTGQPTRRVIEHRANRLLQVEANSRFALALLDIDNFRHINDYYGPTTVRATTRCARTPISRCTASRKTARAPPPFSTPAWSARR